MRNSQFLLRTRPRHHVRTDVRFSHEYVTPMAESFFRAGLGADARVTEPESVYAFRDHLTFLDKIMPEAHIKLGLREQAASLATVQEAFTTRQGIAASEWVRDEAHFERLIDRRFDIDGPILLAVKIDDATSMPE